MYNMYTGMINSAVYMYMHVLKVHSKIDISVIVCLVLEDLYVMFCVKICSGCGFNYTSIYWKTKRAMTLVFVVQLRYI